jgi:hypothetical protein
MEDVDIEWIILAQDGDMWGALLVNMATNLPVP